MKTDDTIVKIERRDSGWVIRYYLKDGTTPVSYVGPFPSEQEAQAFHQWDTHRTTKNWNLLERLRKGKKR